MQALSSAQQVLPSPKRTPSTRCSQVHHAYRLARMRLKAHILAFPRHFAAFMVFSASDSGFDSNDMRVVWIVGPCTATQTCNVSTPCFANIKTVILHRMIDVGKGAQMLPISATKSSSSFFVSEYFLAISSYFFSHWSLPCSSACTLRS